MSGVLRRGVLAGAGAGAALALFLHLVGEPTMARAIVLEAQRDVGGAGEDLFSRGAQEVGGALGALAYGVCLGLVAAVVLASGRRASEGQDQSEWRRAMALAALGFVSVVLVPFLKYPANPPGVGDPDTVGRRTALFLALLAWSVLATWGSWRLYGWLRERGWHEQSRWAAAAGVYAAAAAAALIALPSSPDAVEVPAGLLWRFRTASLGGSAVFWAVLGWILGCLAKRDRASDAGLPGPSRSHRLRR
ncbi:MAG: CbtA family protein [Actinomycetota bacterium]|nr:CbtA family protein [Actinomycetota bacterium]MDQ3679699.1 CbtA family protein [Actinomycetota bacterium]